MKKVLSLLLTALLLLSATACAGGSAPGSHSPLPGYSVPAEDTPTPTPAPTDPPPAEPSPDKKEEAAVNKLTVSFNGYTYTATLADNSSAEAFADLLRKNGGSITIAAHDYGNFEKVGDLPEALPRNDEQITTAPGDLILYLGTELTLYYAKNSWSFTRLGRLDGDLTQLLDHLGPGDVDITYALTKD